MERVKNKFSKPVPRIDKGLPLSIQIGGYVSFNQTPFILYTENSSMLSCPEKDSLEVKAYGKYQFLNDTIHKFYFGDEIGYLQYATDSQGNLDKNEIYFFQTYDEVYPDSQKEWNDWVGEREENFLPHIGAKYFFVDVNDEEVEFVRIIGDGEYYSPIETKEEVFIEPTQDSDIYDKSTMLYSRILNDDTEEFLHLSLLDNTNYCQDESKQTAWIDISVGIKLTVSDITVV